MTRFGILTLAAALGSIAACEGENLFRTAGVSLIDAPMRFEAVELVFEDAFGDRVDLVDQGALFVLLLEDDDDTFETRFRFGAIDVTAAGSFRFDGGELVLSDDPFEDDDIELERSFRFLWVGDDLVLEDPGAVFDMDGDGIEEVAALRVDLQRR